MYQFSASSSGRSFVIETKLHILMQCFQWLIIFTRPKVIFEQNVVVDLLDKY